MRKSLGFTLLICFVLSAAIAGCAPRKTEPASEPIAGGYSEDREVTAEDLIVFEEALAGLEGVNYVPTLVATQVVAGLNYRFTATATPVVPNAESYTAYVYIYEPLDGAPELTEITTVEAE